MTPNWYMLAADGRATLCADKADAEQEARDADTAWPDMGPHRAVQLVEVSQAFSAADMATASAQGFRDGQASQPAAGQEGGMQSDNFWPVDAKASRKDLIHQIGQMNFRITALRQENAGLIKRVQNQRHALGTAPQPAVAAGWVNLPGPLPEPGKPVLLDIGKKYPIRAMWAAKHTVQTADDDTEWGDYVEADDMYYCPEGWYEWNLHEECHWAVSETPRAWCELPAPLPPAPSTEGEINDRT